MAFRTLALIAALAMLFVRQDGLSLGQDEPDATDVAGTSDSSAAATTAINVPARVTEEVNLRSAPEVSNDTLLRTLEPNDAIFVYERLTDQDGEDWYRVGDDQWVHAMEVRLPQTPPQGFPGRWIDVDLSEPAMLTAYEDNEPVFSALAIKGRDAFETPQGTHEILRRVADETMDSTTIGIPRNSPGGYHLEHVLYTQYFTNDGASIHDNYWSDNFGEAGSHGCVGLTEDDAAWMWNWAEVGTVVNIHA